MKYKTKEEILKRAQEAIGIPLGEIDKTGRLDSGKGAIGTVLEESWFGYAPNSTPEPDFPEAKVELKATPYVKNGKNIRAKERLVCNIIDYMNEYKKTFETSDFWHKCETMLIMSYEHKYDIPKADYTIDKAILFSFPDEDRLIIKKDWETIMKKIKDGQAHLLSEGDTLYLAACTKGKNAEDVRRQPFNSTLAMQRAYSLKTSYMSHLLNAYVFGDEEDEHIIKDWRALRGKSFEEVIVERLMPYYGLSVGRLAKMFDLNVSSKSINDLLLSKMLGIEGHASNTVEFRNANIIPKTIRIQRSGSIKESMSFPTFKFMDLINEKWEESTLRNMLAPTRFMFVIFKEKGDDYIFDHIMFWNMPIEDLEEVERVWERTKETIIGGVELIQDGDIVRNNLPKQSESRVAHVRPHARDSSDTYPLPDGRYMPKQSFWLNRTYIESIVLNQTDYRTAVRQNTSSYLRVAEDKGPSKKEKES